MTPMFITAALRLPAARPLACALDAALAFAATDGPLTGVHLQPTETGLIVLGSDGVGISATTVPIDLDESHGLGGQWSAVDADTAEAAIGWLLARSDTRLTLRIGSNRWQADTAGGERTEWPASRRENTEGTADVRDELLRALAALGCDPVPPTAVPAELLNRLAAVDHLGAATAREIELIPTARGWVGTFDERATVFGLAHNRLWCPTDEVLHHITTATAAATVGHHRIGDIEAQTRRILDQKAQR